MYGKYKRKNLKILENEKIKTLVLWQGEALTK